MRQRRTGMPSRWKTSGLSGSRRARRRARASAIGCEMERIRPTNVFERAGESRMTPPASSSLLPGEAEDLLLAPAGIVGEVKDVLPRGGQVGDGFAGVAAGGGIARRGPAVSGLAWSGRVLGGIAWGSAGRCRRPSVLHSKLIRLESGRRTPRLRRHQDMAARASPSVPRASGSRSVRKLSRSPSRHSALVVERTRFW